MAQLQGTTSDGTPGETGRPTERDGDAVGLGAQVIRDASGSMPLTMQWEIKMAAGQHGKLLA